MTASQHTLPASGGVASVNGQTGAVTLGAADVSAAAATHGHAGAWSDATLGASISAGTAVAPGTRLEDDRVFLRGRLAWTTATIVGGTVLMTVAVAHRPITRKTFTVRTGPGSAVSTVLHVDANGEVINEASFGTSNTSYVSIDGFSYDLT